MDITALDCRSINGLSQFELIYSFKSSPNCLNFRFFLKCVIAENALVPSLHYLYKSSLWLEREI